MDEEDEEEGARARGACTRRLAVGVAALAVTTGAPRRARAGGGGGKTVPKAPRARGARGPAAVEGDQGELATLRWTRGGSSDGSNAR